MGGLLGLLVWGAGCTGAIGETPGAGRATLTLGECSKVQDSQAGTLQVACPFDLPGHLSRDGAQLVLEGLWWSAEVQLNGRDLGTVVGGNAPLWVDLGAALKAGPNQLQLEISVPEEGVSKSIHAGGLASDGFDARRPLLWESPRLVLQPTARVDRAVLQAGPGDVRPLAWLKDAPDGSTVAFRAVLDGAELADLGSAPVQDGQAFGEAVPFLDHRWAPGAPALFQLEATLRDPSGAAMDTAHWRTGVRQVGIAHRALQVDGQDYTVASTRLAEHGPQFDFAQRMANVAASGANAFETHGDTWRSRWTQDLDEWGFPLVIIPRCAGRSGVPARNKEPAPELRDQDERFVKAALHTPSLILWSTEGPTHPGSAPGRSAALWTAALVEDPTRRPVVGHDMPGRVLHAPEGPLQTCDGGECAATWIIEITGGKPWAGRWKQMLDVWDSALSAGAVGGTIPVRDSSSTEVDPPAWKATAAKHGLSSGLASGQRASSRVALSGPPGATAWLSADGLGTVGTVLDAEGKGQLQVWHTGPATVTIEGKAHPVTLQSGTWEDYVWTGTPSQVGL